MREVIKTRAIEAVVFDIDGTLTPDGNSWTALSRGLGASVEKHLEIYGGHIKGKIGYEESRRQLIELWQATGNANQQFIENLQAGHEIRTESYDLIEWLKANNYLVCLISSAAISYAGLVANKLGVKDYFSSARLIFDGQGELIDIEYTLEEAVQKVHHLIQFCEKYGLALGSCAVVGDSGNDAEMFRATGNGLLFGDCENEALINASKMRISALSEVAEVLGKRALQ